MTSKHVKSTQPKAGKGPIRYDPETCTYSVPDPEERRLQGKYPYDDIQAAIIQAGKHTKRYSENARQAIQIDPGRALEFDLECWLFSPKPQQQARTLAELAQQIRLCPTFVREALTSEIDAKLAGRDLAKFYPRYYELGGTGFEPTNNAAGDLVCLLESCGGEKRLPRLQEIDVRILKHLNTAEFARKLSDLEAELNVPRETVGKRLKVLRALGLTHRPQGQKGGDAISTRQEFSQNALGGIWYINSYQDIAMKMKIIRNTVRPVILASLATGVILFCLDAVNASMKAEVKNNANVLTAQQIADKIKQHVTCPWQQQTVDTFKAGDPDTPVTGVAVTFMATYDVLRRAARQGCNFVITHEPTFYHGQDDTSQLDPDPVIEAKRKFIEENNLIIWRFHDHIHRTEPDGIVAGMVELFGWESFQKQNERLHFELPEPMSLKQFVNGLKGKFTHSAIRVIGDPKMQFTKFGFAAGASGSVMQMKMLQGEDIEVLIAGETREWETVEYVRDAKDMGRNKALVLLGHSISEEAGMKHCSEWLKSFVNNVPIKFIPAGDPFWTP